MSIARTRAAAPGDRDLPQAAVGRPDERRDAFGRQVAQARGVVRALVQWRDERAFEMRAKDVGACTHRLAYVAQIGFHHAQRIGDEAAHLPRGAMEHVPGARGADAVCAVVERLAPRAVRMDVHIPGREQHAVRVNAAPFGDAVPFGGLFEGLGRCSGLADHTVFTDRPTVGGDAACVDARGVDDAEGLRRPLK